MLYSESRWRDIGYKLKADAKIAEYRETVNHKGKTVDYAVYDFESVEPISGKAAEERRHAHTISFTEQRMNVLARHWWQSHTDATEDETFNAAYNATFDGEMLDAFGNTITWFDNDWRQWWCDWFERAVKDCRDERLTESEDLDLQVRSTSFGVPLCRRDAIPADWRDFKANGEWWKCGYTANDKRKYSRAILEYDDTVSPLFGLDECVELRGEEAAARRKLYHRVVKKRLKDEHRTAVAAENTSA